MWRDIEIGSFFSGVFQAELGTIALMTSYYKATRTELIRRLRVLEAKLAGGKWRPDNASGEQASSPIPVQGGEWLHIVVQTAAEGVVTISELGSIEAINPAAENMFGYVAKEIVGKNVRMLMPAPFRHRHDDRFASYVRTGKVLNGGAAPQLVGRRKDGTLFPIDLSVVEARVGRQRLFAGFVRDITERKRLEKEILEISEREQRRIGQDLHDGLGQHLAAIELMSRVLQQKLEHKSRADAGRAAKIGAQVREAMLQTRLLARGLSPVVLESRGLVAALQELSASTEKLFRVKCCFGGNAARPVEDNAVATHLYRIAQEAVSNAVKHGKASRIEIQLNCESGQLALAVKDNGVGFSEVTGGKGMGLLTMNYRAAMIGGALLIRRLAGRGTVVLCTFHPTPAKLHPKEKP